MSDPPEAQRPVQALAEGRILNVRAVSPIDTSEAFRIGPLWWLALGTFAIGTEAFMIAQTLPRIAHDHAVCVSAAGQLMTAFSLFYAISSPFTTALTGRMNRRRILMVAMGAFCAAN